MDIENESLLVEEIHEINNVDGNEDIESWLSHIETAEAYFTKDISIVKQKALD